MSINERANDQTKKQHMLCVFLHMGLIQGLHTSFFSTSNIGRKYGPLLDWRWDPTIFFSERPEKAWSVKRGEALNACGQIVGCSAWSRSVCFFQGGLDHWTKTYKKDGGFVHPLYDGIFEDLCWKKSWGIWVILCDILRSNSQHGNRTWKIQETMAAQGVHHKLGIVSDCRCSNYLNTHTHI